MKKPIDTESFIRFNRMTQPTTFVRADQVCTRIVRKLARSRSTTPDPLKQPKDKS